MDGIIYRISDNLIIGVINDVVSYTDIEVVGKSASMRGIDLSKASFCIVESTTLHEGDILGTFTDIRDELPKTPDQLRIVELEAQLSVMNTNNIEFMEMILQTLGVE